jgi:four helix bundle suffix protein
MRNLGRTHHDGEYFMGLAQTRPPETIANMAIVLLKQADYLLHKQIQRLSDDFVKEGGFSERMMRVRKEYRNNGK